MTANGRRRRSSTQATGSPAGWRNAPEASRSTSPTPVWDDDGHVEEFHGEGRPSNGIPERLIAAAVTMLAEEGPSAIKARTVAAKAGMSSMVVYNYFGGVPELLGAVVDHGFDQLGEAVAQIGASEDAIADLFTMALTTLSYA